MIKDIEAVRALEGFKDCGFQASKLADAVELIEEMKQSNATIFLGFTANLVASGLRGLITTLCKKKFVDVVVTTAGSIDHDVIKCFADYKLGKFNADDVELHKKGINRLGNIFIPVKHFEMFEEKMQNWLQEIYKKEKIISPSELTSFIGGKLNETSFLYHCTKNKIPVFCPGITDGAIGLQMYFFRRRNPDFVVDVTKDMDCLAQKVLSAGKTGAIVLGGGITKHHILGVNLLRDGLDYAAYFTTAQEYDGSLSGAQTREGKSWGKIQEMAKTVTVYGDATITFPLVFSELKEKGKI